MEENTNTDQFIYQFDQLPTCHNNWNNSHPQPLKGTSSFQVTILTAFIMLALVSKLCHQLATGIQTQDNLHSKTPQPVTFVLLPCWKQLGEHG
jgi:hypothetical protein